MSAYNTVECSATCPSCKNTVWVRVQFKYGNTWQLAYRVGDTLQWGGNDIGRPGKRKVVLDAAAEGKCPVCGYDGDWDLYVWVEHDRITWVETADGRFGFTNPTAPFEVVLD